MLHSKSKYYILLIWGVIMKLKELTYTNIDESKSLEQFVKEELQRLKKMCPRERREIAERVASA